MQREESKGEIRWEWRSFARKIALSVDLAAYPRVRHLDSAEIYLVTAKSVDNLKIRNDALDIKLLKRRSDDGLELWEPSLKARFPLSGIQVAAAYHALGLAAPSDAGDCDLKSFLKMIGDDPGVWVVAVNKSRDKYAVDDCLVESSVVTLDGERCQTIAVEDHDIDKVRETVARLGLGDCENISYVTAIQRVKAGRLS